MPSLGNEYGCLATGCLAIRTKDRLVEGLVTRAAENWRAC
jgi:hypothetical protein